MSKYLALYKAVWFWKDGTLECNQDSDRRPSITIQKRTNKRKSRRTVIKFLENVDQNGQTLFKQKYQRTIISKHRPSVVTIQDVKDLVTFLAVGTIPKDFLVLFHSYEINNVFRALIVYFQLYLQVNEDLNYRRKKYATQLKHPISVVRESMCKTQLSILRSCIGKEYASLIIGSGTYNNFHHMNNPINRSYSIRDIKIYEYLMSFSIQVVWISLGRTCLMEIENEMARLFSSRDFKNYSSNFKTSSDHQILHGDVERGINDRIGCSAVIKDIYLNQDIYEMFSKDLENTALEDTVVGGTYALLNLPEELLDMFELTVGILGQPRKHFDPMLNLKRDQRESMAEEDLRTDSTIQLEPSEKPYVKLYQYLEQLVNDSRISVKQPYESYGGYYIKDQINLFLNFHKEDAVNALAVWCERR